MLTLPIREVVPATPRAQIVRVDLKRHPFDYAAGQAVLVGAPGAEARRAYSIANAPEDARRHDCLELLVGMEGAAAQPAPGDMVEVEGPVGVFTFPAKPVERNFLFVAGGTGIAPLRAMLRHAILSPQPTRHVGLLYSARTPDEFVFTDEFQALASSGIIDFRRTITRDTAAAWSGARGRIGRDTLAPLLHDPETLCFVCGPVAMVDDIPKLLVEMGVEKERIKIEEW